MCPDVTVKPGIVEPDVMCEGLCIVRGALQRMFEKKMAVEQPVKAKINVQVRIKICKV